MAITSIPLPLPNGSTHNSASSDDAYLVRSGKIAVHLLPEGGKYGPYGSRLLCEVGAGEAVPALHYRDADYQWWTLRFTALEDTELLLMEHASTKPLRNRFLERSGIADVANQGYEDSLVDWYLSSYVKGVIHIAHSGKDRHQTERDTRERVEAPLRDDARAETVRMAPLRDMLRFCLHGASKSAVTLAAVLSVVTAALSLVVPWFVRACFDDVLPAGSGDGLATIGIAAVLGALAYGLVSAMRAIAAHQVETDAQRSVTARVRRSVFELPARTVRARGSVQTVRDAEALGRLAHGVASATVGIGFGAIIGLVAMAQMAALSPELAGVALALCIPVFALSYAFTSARYRYESQASRASAAGSSAMYQFLDAIEKVRAAGFEPRAINAYTRSSANYHEQSVLAQRMAAIEWAASASCLGLGVIALCATAAAVGASAGLFAATVLLYGLLVGAVRGAATGAARLNKHRASFVRYRNLVDISQRESAPGEPVECLSGAIDIEDVSFAYDEEAGDVLKGVTLHIAPGERVGIAGASGCGKSTLLRLLIGLERPSVGAIRYDGRDMTQLDGAALRRRMGVVLQDGRLIPGSLYENVELTAPGIGEDAVNRAIDAAALRADVNRMPMGLATYVGESGKLLSGGQRQRALLARALVRDPDVLLLDEVTSALDADKQMQVMRSLEQRECTQVFVAHRMDALASCDRIIVLEGGRIVQEGTYAQMIGEDGPFARLAARDTRSQPTR